MVEQTEMQRNFQDTPEDGPGEYGDRLAGRHENAAPSRMPGLDNGMMSNMGGLQANAGLSLGAMVPLGGMPGMPSMDNAMGMFSMGSMMAQQQQHGPSNFNANPNLGMRATGATSMLGSVGDTNLMARGQRPPQKYIGPPDPSSDFNTPHDVVVWLLRRDDGDCFPSEPDAPDGMAGVKIQADNYWTFSTNSLKHLMFWLSEETCKKMGKWYEPRELHRLRTNSSFKNPTTLTRPRESPIGDVVQTWHYDSPETREITLKELGWAKEDCRDEIVLDLIGHGEPCGAISWHKRPWRRNSVHRQEDVGSIFW